MAFQLGRITAHLVTIDEGTYRTFRITQESSIRQAQCGSEADLTRVQGSHAASTDVTGTSGP
ncbi:hypothetical protein ACFSC4_27295 [Deinococcus malanensis]|uniref:hypothetical protein n=1 Tax=Deinococcus malanensis TaxID=1706855 RepID=UPI003632EE0E